MILPLFHAGRALELVSVMVVSFGQRPPSMRLRSHDPCRISLLTDHTCHDMVTLEGCSGRNVTPSGHSFFAELLCFEGALDDETRRD